MLETERRSSRLANLGARPASDTSQTGGDPAFNAKATREYCGRISEMTMWRWTREHDFPKPDFVLGGKRFWRKSKLDNWLAEMAARHSAASPGSPNEAR